MAPTSPNDFARERQWVANYKAQSNNQYYYDAGYERCLLRVLSLARRYPNLNYLIKRLEEENNS